MFVLVTLPGVISGYMKDPIRIGEDPHIKVLSVVYASTCFFGGAAMIWYMIFQLGVDEDVKSTATMILRSRKGGTMATRTNVRCTKARAAV